MNKKGEKKILISGDKLVLLIAIVAVFALFTSLNSVC